MKRIGLLTALLLTTATAFGAPPLRWGEFGYLSRWDRPSYEIDSEWPFLTELPTLDRFPELLKAAANPKLDDGDRKLAILQLETLSRCEFFDSLKSLTDEPFYQEALKRWQTWWDQHGKAACAALPEKGKTYPDAWKKVADTPYLPCPTYPVLIPDHWSFELTFRSGDYSGVVEEILSMKVTPDQATLQRKYQPGTDASWVYETWEGLTVEQARSFFAMMIYTIDHPWVYQSDQIDEGSRKNKIGQIAGRPKQWTNYHPGVQWSGVLDANGQVILNSDPWHWDSCGGGVEQTKTSLDLPIGVMFRLLRDHFPDPSYSEELSRWKKVEAPK